MTVYIPNVIDPKKLVEVTEEMRTLGAPTIRVHYNGEAYEAIEGSHRVTAAHDLGLVPIFERVEEDDIIDNHDIYRLPDSTTVLEIIDHLYQWPKAYVTFPDD